MAVAQGVMPGALLAPAAEVPAMVADLCQAGWTGRWWKGGFVRGSARTAPACRGRQLDSHPLPGSGKPDGIDGAGAARQAGRIFDAIQDMVADGTVTEIANQWFFMPQQRYVRQRLIERERWHLGMLYAAALALLLVSVRFWLRARSCDGRRRKPGRWREAERLFEAFMAHSPAVSVLKDANGRILYVNRAFERATVWKPRGTQSVRPIRCISPARRRRRCARRTWSCCAPVNRGRTC